MKIKRRSSVAGLLALALLALFPVSAHAGCTAPNGAAGTILYNEDDRVLAWCDDTNWHAAGPVGGSVVDMDTATRDDMGAALGGSHKWKGGVAGTDGKIYGMPFTSADILIINPATGTATRSAMGADLSGTGKWASGVVGPDGKIYGIPASSTDILIIDPVAGTAIRDDMGASLSGTDKWYGGVVGPDGKIYGIPSNSIDILIIDPVAGTAIRDDMGADLSGSGKWNGGVLTPDGKIYGIPHHAADILIIDPVAGTATRDDMGAVLSGTGKWASGVVGPDGKIYGIPSNSIDILIIDPVGGTAILDNMGADLSGSAKWYGGVLAPDGKIYGMPNFSTDILSINPIAGTATRDDMGADLSGDFKWYGVASGPDGKIYGIPFGPADILIIEGVPPGDCALPDGPAGTMVFNSDHAILQYCDGQSWQGIGKIIIKDIDPDAFAFVDLDDQSLSTVVTSNIVTITGIDPGTSVSISGDGSPQFRIDGGSWTSGPATIDSGQTLQLSLTSSASFAAVQSATVTVGSLSDQWNVTTIAQDTTPDAFAFTDQTDVAVSTQIESNIVQITGITGSVATSIAGQGSPQYRICGNATCSVVVDGWGSGARTIDNTQYLQLRLTSSGSGSTARSATVTVGTGSDNWSVTTTAPSISYFNGPNVWVGGTSVTIPASAQAGDLAVLWNVASNVFQTVPSNIATPAGWTIAESHGDYGSRVKLFYKILSGGDPGTTVTNLLDGGANEGGRLLIGLPPEKWSSLKYGF